MRRSWESWKYPSLQKEGSGRSGAYIKKNDGGQEIKKIDSGFSQWHPVTGQEVSGQK